MAIKTKIEYADSTINPTPCCKGCELYHKDPKLNHCYAADMVRRYAGLKGWPDDFNTYQFFPGRIEKACNWSDLTGTERPDKPWLNGMPRVIFLNDMGDSCSPIHPLDWTYPYIEMMEASPHIWLWLTKWPLRMHRMLWQTAGYVPRNFWLGTTVTGPETIKRAPQLIALKDFGAQTLWLSLEPLLKSVDVTKWLGQIDWVAYGGESGRNARPSPRSSFRHVSGSCTITETPQFFKQHGEWLHASQFWPRWSWDKVRNQQVFTWPNRSLSFRMGKVIAGRLLDGKEWSEMPEWKR